MERAAPRTPVQLFNLVIGTVYVVLGLIGFAVTGLEDFASESHEKLLVFHVNPLHNLVHIASGLVWLASVRTHTAAKNAALAVGLIYGLVTVLGLVGALGFLSIESLADPDNFLHLVTAAISLYFGSVGAEAERVRA